MKLEGGRKLKGKKKETPINVPLITIITVVFNAKTTIEKTIKSVKEQDYQNIEYIIIDGGSTDGTVDVLRQNEEEIDYWLSEKDGGIYDAMNKGWSFANPKSLILFLGSGDLILTLPKKEDLAKYQNYIIYGTVMLENGPFNSVASWKLKLGNTIHHQALLVPKSLHQSSPFNTAYPTYADYDFHLRMYLRKEKFIFSKEFTAYALPGGFSGELNVQEMVKVSRRNNGFKWGILSFTYCSYQAVKAYLMKGFYKRLTAI